MTEEAIVRLIVLAVQAFPPIASAVLGVLRPDVARSVREQIDGARATMDGAPSPTPGVEALVAREKAAARHEESLASELEAIARTQGVLLSAPERASLRAAASRLRGLPPALEVP